MMKYKGHVGMNFTNEFAQLFCFQLLNSDGVADAVVDFHNGLIVRVLVAPKLALKQAAIIKLAKIYKAKYQPGGVNA